MEILNVIFSLLFKIILSWNLSWNFVYCLYYPWFEYFSFWRCKYFFIICLNCFRQLKKSKELFLLSVTVWKPSLQGKQQNEPIFFHFQALLIDSLANYETNSTKWSYDTLNKGSMQFLVPLTTFWIDAPVLKVPRSEVTYRQTHSWTQRYEQILIYKIDIFLCT